MQPNVSAGTAVHSGAAPARQGQALLTYCDDATGERTVLTADALGSWAARTAGLLYDGCGLGVGDRAAVLLPPHWQSAAVLLGAWSVGIAVSFRPWATAGLPPPDFDADEPVEAVFVSRQRLDSWLESVPTARHRFVLGLQPHRTPSPVDVPAGYRDYLTEVARYSDCTPPYGSILGTDAASPDGTTFREWESLAQEIAATLDLHPGDRLLVDAGAHEQPVAWLLAPLTAGASIVICANLDRRTLGARIAAEGITRVL
ncbi:TIGR03089 family protein [Krasilnikovia sp. MM14-A1259]|uniref:TIGR03089 family protein n=1 Tax=Krasilnikovia sp. MM14-A1259 TaxID=3373539 RepID=UPI003820CC6C